MAKLVPGVNDLATTNPELASQAYGWDPTTVTQGSNGIKEWWCEKGHAFHSSIKNRALSGNSCGVCNNRQVLVGYNDLATTHPSVAAQAYGWDPKTVPRGSNDKKLWWCEKGHTFTATIYQRARGTGCAVCRGLQIHIGFNDLASTYPEIAAQAFGWDPKTVTKASHSKKTWRCKSGHNYLATVAGRTRGGGCPYCSGKAVLVGVNDLKTTHPEIAAQAIGWDPTSVSAGSNKKREWLCEKQGHPPYVSHVYRRVSGDGCPVCRGLVVVSGVNDLEYLFPGVAKEACGWDPKTVTPKSNKLNKWCCQKCGHTWQASVYNRTPPTSSGCPKCCESGFNPGSQAWFYLLERPGEQQLGITNYKEDRLYKHSRSGWSEVEVVGPFPGDQVLATEKKFKKWLRKEVGLVPGTTENWFTARMEVQSLAELKARSGIETDLF